LCTGPLFRRSAIPTGNRVRDSVRVRVRVRVWIVWYMDAQTAARFGIADLQNSGPESFYVLKNRAVLSE